MTWFTGCFSCQRLSHQSVAQTGRNPQACSWKTQPAHSCAWHGDFTADTVAWPPSEKRAVGSSLLEDRKGASQPPPPGTSASSETTSRGAERWDAAAASAPGSRAAGGGGSAETFLRRPRRPGAPLRAVPARAGKGSVWTCNSTSTGRVCGEPQTRSDSLRGCPSTCC